MTAPVFEMMAEKCHQCLHTPNRIVSGVRAAQLIEDCRRQDIKFICHLGTIVGRDIACRGQEDLTGGCAAHRFAKAVGIEVVEVDPKCLSDS